MMNDQHPVELQVFAVVFNADHPNPIRQFGQMPIMDAVQQGPNVGDQVLVVAFDHERGIPVLVDPVEIMSEVMALREAHAENIARDDAVYAKAAAENVAVDAAYEAMWAEAHSENETVNARFDAAWAAAHAEDAVRELTEAQDG